MKILQLKTSSGRGGAETILLSLTGELLDRGHQVDTVFAEPGWLVERFAEAGYDTCVQKINGVHFLTGMGWLLRRIRREEYDLVLSHGAVVNLWGSLAAGLIGTPSVSVEHNVDTWRSSSPGRNAIDRIAGRFNSKRIAVSAAVGEMLCDLRIVPESKIVTVPNAVDLSIQAGEGGLSRSQVRERFGLDGSHFVIVTVARLVEQKGHRYLLDSIPSVLAKFPEVRFLFCGGGDLEAVLRAQAVSLGIEDSVVFAGSVDGIVDVLKASDMFVLPSLWEGMPISLLEAMAAELPIVATAVAGTPEVIDDGETGVLVQPKDSLALAKGVLSLLENEAKMKLLAANACQEVKDNYSVTRLVDRYLEVFEQCF